MRGCCGRHSYVRALVDFFSHHDDAAVQAEAACFQFVGIQLTCWDAEGSGNSLDEEVVELRALVTLEYVVHPPFADDELVASFPQPLVGVVT